jgi:hypothetical protein
LRIDRIDKAEARRLRLLGAATKERDTLALRYEIALQGHKRMLADYADMGFTPKEDLKAPHLRLAKRISKAQRAINILTLWRQDDGALPRTWHGVLKKE